MNSNNIDPLTDEEKKYWPKKEIIDLEEPFVDERGEIQPLVDGIMKSAVMIFSKAGSLRANHYHKTDWHYCYVVSGQINYYHRKTNTLIEPKLIIVKKGQMVFTPPMVDHAMKFPVDTTFITLSRNPRDQQTYEKDVIRINMMDTTNCISWQPNKEVK